jgi:radical SAM superfamily enzyme YgiQ (UPF0313 family)
MKGRVLLVVHDVYQDDNEFPLGVAYLASVLRRAGIDVRIYCQDVFHYSNHHLAELLQGSDFDLIGLGFLAARYGRTVEPLCEVINKCKKEAWLVLGGHGPSPIPEYVLNKTQADVVAIGESEDTIVDLVRCKANREGLADVEGIAYRQDGEVAVNARRRPIMDLDTIPFPAWELLPTETYASCCLYPGQEKAERSLAMIATRGCLGRCSFCYRMEKGIRLRSIENVVEEMKCLSSKYGVSYFCFQDELFVLNKRRLFEFEDALQRQKLRIKFSCNARVDMFDREMAQCLKQMGCKKINVGFESMNQKVLDGMCKRTTVEENIRFAETAKEAGLNMGLNVIWGNPYDTEESLKGIVEFLKKYNTYGEVRTIRPVTPYPGSPLYYDAIQKGLLEGPDDFFNKFRNSDLLTVNFTDIPEDRFYQLLFAANRELITDHFRHTNGDTAEARKLIDSFHELYFSKQHAFSGARHYERK